MSLGTPSEADGANNAELEERVNALLVGAIDMHCHSGPSVMPRCLDHIEAAQEASAAGMRALLFKDHFYSVTPITELLTAHYSHLNVTLVSGVPLNDTSGGLNPYAVDHGRKLGESSVAAPAVVAATRRIIEAGVGRIGSSSVRTSRSCDGARRRLRRSPPPGPQTGKMRHEHSCATGNRRMALQGRAAYRCRSRHRDLDCARRELRHRRDRRARGRRARAP